MKKMITIASLLLLTACGGKAHDPTHPNAHWGYDGEAGPKNWAKLNPENTPCAGKNQSPINLAGFIEAELPPLAFKYGNGTGK